MISSIVDGTDECPTQGIARIIKSSKDFHLLLKKWPSFTSDLKINQVEIEKRKQNLLLEKQQLSEVVHDVIALWVGENGSGTTLDKLISALDSNELGSISGLLRDEFQMKSSEWDVPSYYISRTLITRILLDKNKLMEELQSTRDIFIFTGITMSGLSNILKNKMVENSTRIVQDSRINHNYILLDYPTHFSKICEKTKCPVHLIKYDEKRDKWIHVRSSGSLSAMQNIIDKSQPQFNETELINFIAAETHPVCISDSPGMGKSTILQHIGQQLSKIENNRKVLFATMSELVAVFMQNDANDDVEKKALVELTLNKLFCNNAAQTSSLFLKLNSRELEIELLLDGLDEVASSNVSNAFDLLKYLSTIPSIRVWVTTRPHLLEDVENSLNVFGYNIQAFTKENQIRFLKDFWLFRNTNLVPNRLEQFAGICLEELNAKVSRKDGYIAGIPLQCLLIGEVYEEQAHEHSVATTPNETWIIHINSLVELYKRLIEKQYTKYKLTSDSNLLTDEQLNRQHIRLAVQLIFPELLEELPISFKEDININELLKVGLLEKSSTVFEPKFVHRTIGEFLIAKLLVQLLNLSADSQTLNCLSQFLNKVLVCQINYVNLHNIYHHSTPTNYFVKNEICHFLDTLLFECDKKFCFDTDLNFKSLIQACVYGDYFNLFETILVRFNRTVKSSAQRIFDDNLFFLALKYSGITFPKIILENNPTLLDDQEIQIRSLLLATRNGKLAQLRYLLNVSNVRKLVTRPTDESKCVIHECVEISAWESISIVKQKIEIFEILLNINSDLLEQRDKYNRTPILCRKIHVELLRKLVERNANVFAKGRYQNTILHLNYEHLDVMFEGLPSENTRSLLKIKNEEGETPLMTLAKNKELSLDILNKFKEFGADFNCKDNEGYSVLARCILEFRTTETIKRLIDFGANVHWKKGWKRKSLLHVAAQCGNVEAMNFLETQFKMNINDKDWSFKSSDEYLGNSSQIRYRDLSSQQINNIFNKTKDLNLSLSPENKTDMLEMCVKYMNYSAVEYFLKDGADFIKNNDIKWRIVENLIGYFELESGSKILKRLINLGITEEHNNSLIAFTPWGTRHFLLHLAVVRGGIEIVTLLVDEYKQNVNAADDNGKTTLQYLISGGQFYLEKANFLLSKGADATVLDGEGNTLLHLAASKGSDESMTWCLDLGLDLNAANAKGESPLHKLVSLDWDYIKPKFIKWMVSQLCDHGANVFQVDKKGWNVLHHLAGSGKIYEEVLDYFLEKGLDINAIDNEGNTPLHIAAAKKFLYLLSNYDGDVKLLLEKEADKTIRNKNEETPYQICKLEVLKL